MTETTTLTVPRMGKVTLRSLEKIFGGVKIVRHCGTGVSFEFDTHLTMFYGGGEAYEITGLERPSSYPERKKLQRLSAGIMSAVLLSNQAMGMCDTALTVPHQGNQVKCISTEAVRPADEQLIDPPSFNWDSSIYSAIKASEEFAEPLYANH